DSGLAPRSIESLPPNLQDAARYGVARFNQDFLAFQERIAARGESFWPAHKSKLRALKDRLRNAQSNARSREIAIHDIIEAQAGELGLSGSLASRSAEKHLRDNIAILTRMMQELGKIDPDINVQRVRDALLAGEPLYGGSVNEAARAVGVSEEALLNILRLTRSSQEFRHAVVDIYNAASRAAQNAVITAIEEIESAIANGDFKAASEIADRAIARQRAARKRWVNLEEGLGRDIDALEVDRQEQELLERIAKSIEPNLS